MKKREIVLIILACIVVFLFVYSPHFKYSYPYHNDEWHHITEGLKIANFEYQFAFKSFDVNGFEFGFHLFLAFLSIFFDLVLIYPFLPAIFAVISSLMLFFLVYKKTNNFYIGLFSILFFATIKSNVNILGLWFFTPLTFAIPLIFLYIYLFTEGLEKQNKKLILASLGVIGILLFTHVVSFLFSIPILLFYGIIHYKYILKEKKFFLQFLWIPIIGILFFSMTMNLSLINSLKKMFDYLQFKYGWGVYEIKNSPEEIYSIIGYVFAAIGLASIFLIKSLREKCYLFAIWGLTLLSYIGIYRLFKISPLSPYQRNLYYLAICLPILSAIGLFVVINYLIIILKKYEVNLKSTARIIFVICIIVIVFSFAFKDYNVMRKDIGLYKYLDDKDYEAIKFLKLYPQEIIMASPRISMTIYPIIQRPTVFGIFFYHDENTKLSNQFFSSKTNCKTRQSIINKLNVKYLFSNGKMNCGWKLIYKKNSNYIYVVKNNDNYFNKYIKIKNADKISLLLKPGKK